MFKKFFAGLVLALASVGSASAEFIIDSFNVSGGSLPSLAGGVTVSRGQTAGGDGSWTFGGTNIALDNGTLGGNHRLSYSFSSALSNVGDALGGAPSLRLDFLSADSGWGGSYSINGASFVSFGIGSSGTPFSVAFSVPTLLNATGVAGLRLNFTNANDNARLVIDRLTATPEPTSMLMLGSCLGAGWYARRRIVKGKKATKA